MQAPRPEVDSALIQRLRREGTGRSRPYLVVRITGWSGEVVLTVFLRLTPLKDRDLLFVEASYSLLTPLRDRYLEVDRLSSWPTARQVGRLALAAAVYTPFALIGSMPRLLRAAFAPLERFFRDRHDLRKIEHDRTFNYGASLAPRELAQDDRYHRYFQQLDKEMYAKMAERRILDALAEFFESHGIDTSDFTERETTILNNGVFITGQARVNAGTIAGGWRARAVQVIRKGEQR